MAQFPDARRVLFVLKNELSEAITQINLDRKSADLTADLIHTTWQPQGILLFYKEECNVRFGQRQSLTLQMGLYDDVVLFLQNKQITMIVPRTAIYDFGYEQNATIMLRWRHHIDSHDTRIASLHMGDSETAEHFIRILATT